MSLGQFFTSIIEMAQEGNWGGIWTIIVGAFVFVVGSIGGTGTLFLAFKSILSLFGNKRFLNALGSFKDKFDDTLKNEVLSFKEEMQKNTKEIQNAFNNKISTISSRLDELDAKLEAFSQVALNTEQLKLEFQLLQNEILATKNQLQKAEIVEEVEEVEEVKEEQINEIREVVLEKPKKQPKPKKKKIDYVD